MAQKDLAVDDAMVSGQLQKKAEEHLKAGRYADAIGLYRKLVERHPGKDSFLLALAWACHDDGQLEEAVACFEQLYQKELSRKVFTGFAFDELVRIFKRQGRYDRLLDVCERAIKAQPDDFALLGDLGDACLKTGQVERAADIYRQMVGMEPDSSVPYCNLGHALIAMADFTGAEAAYEKAVAVEPEKEAPYYCRLADQYRQAGHRERAEQAIRKSLAREASEPAYYLMLGDILIEGGRLDEGCTAYESAVDLRQSSAGAYYFRLGNTLANASHHEKAVAAFQKAITAESKTPLYFLKLAGSYLALGQENSALEAVKQAEFLK